MTPDKLMVVAHPDDETIYGAAELVREPGWHVICVTNGDNPVRRMEFERVLASIPGCEGEIWSFPDQWGVPLSEEVRTQLGMSVHGYKKVVSHGPNGEYGHLHHKQIYKWMRDLVGPQLRVFHIGVHPLTGWVWNLKLRLITNYRSQRLVCKNNLNRARFEATILLTELGCLWNRNLLK